MSTRERLLGMLDSTTRRLERDDGEVLVDTGELADAIEEIRGVLVKLDAGYYGVCEMCEGPSHSIGSMRSPASATV